MLSDGQHTFEVRATDQAGNTDQTPASSTFTVDTIPPVVTIDDGPTGPTADNTPTFQFSSPDGTAAFQCRVDAGPFASCTSPYTTSVLSDGTHTVYVMATDPAGNSTTDSQSFLVDTTPPQTTVDSGPTGPTTDTTPSFTYSSSEPNPTFECRIDSDAFAPCDTTGFTASELADGPHTFEVRAIGCPRQPGPEPRRRGASPSTRRRPTRRSMTRRRL